MTDQWIIGADEVGRGPLAGPVTVCAVLVKAGTKPVEGVTDSKKLSAKRRQELAAALVACPEVKYALASVSAEEIDSRGISDALRVCFKSAVEQVIQGNAIIQIDGDPIKGLAFPAPTEYIVKGDSKVWAIGAASIIAKVHRDAMMAEAAGEHPEYGWSKNMGYGTTDHIAAIKEHGLSPLHRKTFCKAFVKSPSEPSVFEGMFGS